MKISPIIKLLPILLAVSLIFINIQLARAEVIQIERDFQPDPLVLSAKSGGLKKTNCGYIDSKPNHVIEVTESIPYLRLTLEGKGKPTLLIDSEEGRFCVLADSYSQKKPEISGYWQAGKYSLYIGDLSKVQHTYTLSISQQKMPQK